MNFKDEYQKELEYYNPEASAERLRKIKLKERRMEDIKAIPYFIIAFLILGFAWWLLCTERTEKISNTYHGYIFQKSENVVDDKFKEPLTLTIEGELTYASKVSKRLTAIDVTITLKDTDGNVVFRNSNYVNCDFPQDGLTGYQLAEYTEAPASFTITYCTGLSSSFNSSTITCSDSLDAVPFPTEIKSTLYFLIILFNSALDSSTLF